MGSGASGSGSNNSTHSCSGSGSLSGSSGSGSWSGSSGSSSGSDAMIACNPTLSPTEPWYARELQGLKDLRTQHGVMVDGVIEKFNHEENELNIDELYSAVREYGYRIPWVQVESAFRHIDADNSGRISQKEFTNAIGDQEEEDDVVPLVEDNVLPLVEDSPPSEEADSPMIVNGKAGTLLLSALGMLGALMCLRSKKKREVRDKETPLLQEKATIVI